MHKLTDSLAAKITAIFLLTLLFAAAVTALLTAVYIEEQNYYGQSGFNFYTSEACRTLNQIYANAAFYDYYLYQEAEDKTNWDDYQVASAQEMLNPQNSNFLFEVYNEAGELVYGTYNGETVGIVANYNNFYNNDQNYRVACYVRSPLQGEDRYAQSAAFHNRLFAMRYTILIAGAFLLILCLALLIFLLTASGHKQGREGISFNWLDKIPYDLYLAIAISIFCLPLLLMMDYGYYGDAQLASILLCMVPCFTGMMLLLLASMLTTATRLKSGSMLHNTIIWKICHFIFQLFKGIFIGFRDLLLHLPVLYKTILLSGCFFLCNLVLFWGVFSSYNSGFWALLLVLFYAGLLYLFCKINLQLRLLANGGKQIAGGNADFQINTKRMLPSLKAHGENLNNISVGMNKAVDARMKSEKLKTELITNVSHDIKTPLTSIISYIDLLKKEPLSPPQALEYLAVLDRQSAKLKKLTEDLLEASKAATGNINVALSKTDVAELLQQTVAEYQEKLAAAQLEPVISIGTENPLILADGRLLWRVLDNLLNNVCKYSMAHTRVYFQVGQSKDKILITLKNISREPLNVSANELMERFVRGDSARSTEGSGLGLSIARSLTELQKGSLSLEIDGDLFKAQLSFDQANGYNL